MTDDPAPIALFVYRRPDKAERTLESLARCIGFDRRPLYVFSDGPRGAEDRDAVATVRALVAKFPHPDKRVVQAETNQGLARSIIGGVTRVCGDHGRIVVLEDDLVVSPALLEYFDAALDAYADKPRVMQISAYAFGGAAGDRMARFLPLTTSWGWATWSRAWEAFDSAATGSEALRTDVALRRRFDAAGLFDYADMLERQKRGLIDSWAIRWYWSVFSRGGLVLYPPESMVRNEGFDRSGTHGSRSVKLWRRASTTLPQQAPELPEDVEIAPDALASVAQFVDPYRLRRLRRLVFRSAARERS